MRRKEREVTERDKIEDILRACKVCRLAINDEDGTPYIVPLNFGYGWKGVWPILYMHCALEGRKLDLLRRDSRVGFETDCAYAIEGQGEEACTYTNHYASVIGTGECEIVTTADEKEIGLRYLMNHAVGEKDWSFDPHWVERTVLLRVRVDNLSAKQYMGSGV